MSWRISALSFDGDMTLWDSRRIMRQKSSESRSDPATVEEIQ